MAVNSVASSSMAANYVAPSSDVFIQLCSCLTRFLKKRRAGSRSGFAFRWLRLSRVKRRRGRGRGRGRRRSVLRSSAALVRRT